MESVKYTDRLDLEIFEGELTSHHYPWHFHNCYTITFIESGSMKYVYRDNEIIVNSDQIHIINPFVSHCNFPIKNCGYKAIFLPMDALLQNESSNSMIHFEETVLQDKELLEKLKKIFDSAKSSSGKKKIERVKSDLREALFQHFPFTQKTPAIDIRIIPAIEFINGNLDKKLSARELAQQCFLSPYHFQRVFKTATGLTVNDFIQQQRTAFGKELIRKGNQIGDAAYEVGYFDQSHFNKTFKKMWVAKPSHFK